MSVYVDDAIWPFGRMVMCHMLADSTAELLAMADRIGVARKWIQKPGTPREHFDICKARRVLAVKYGAVEVDRREFLALVRWKEAEQFKRERGLGGVAVIERALLAALVLALASPLAAQEPEPPAEPAAVEAPSLADYIAPAAWCPLRSSAEPEAFGCDAGLAVSLVDRSWRDYSAAGVVFVGAETVGLGVAWCRSRLCVGAGVAAVRDEFGIDTDSVAPVVGATFSIGGLRE